MHGYGSSHCRRNVKLRYSHCHQQQTPTVEDIQVYLHHDIDERERRRPHKCYELGRGGGDERSG